MEPSCSCEGAFLSMHSFCSFGISGESPQPRLKVLQSNVLTLEPNHSLCISFHRVIDNKPYKMFSMVAGRDYLSHFCNRRHNSTQAVFVSPSLRVFSAPCGKLSVIPHEWLCLPNPHLDARFNVSEGWRALKTPSVDIGQLLTAERGKGWTLCFTVA